MAADRQEGRTPHRVVAAASLSVVVGTLPVFLLGALAVVVRDDLTLTDSQLGLGTGLYFAAAALSSVPASRMAARFGTWATTVVAAGISAACMLTMAAAADHVVVMSALTVAGTGAAFATMGSNEALARAVPRRRQGVAFGIKQAAVPGSTLLAGLAVPVVGLTLGWRPAFGLGAALALVCIAVTPRSRRGPAHATRRAAPIGTALPALVLVALAAGIGAASANAAATFLVASSVTSGVSTSRAGLLLAAGSAVGVLVRVWIGWRADRSRDDPFLVVGGMLGLGAVGAALLSSGDGRALVPGAVLALGLGWGWPGLLNLAVLRVTPSSGAAATSVTQTGVYAGAAAGPACFGLVVHFGSYRGAWLLTSLALLVAAGIMLYGRVAVLHGEVLPAK